MASVLSPTPSRLGTQHFRQPQQPLSWRCLVEVGFRQLRLDVEGVDSYGSMFEHVNSYGLMGEGLGDFSV